MTMKRHDPHYAEAGADGDDEIMEMTKNETPTTMTPPPTTTRTAAAIPMMAVVLRPELARRPIFLILSAEGQEREDSTPESEIAKPRNSEFPVRKDSEKALETALIHPFG